MSTSEEPPLSRNDKKSTPRVQKVRYDREEDAHYDREDDLIEA